MKIVFFGTSEFAIPSLKALINARLVPIAVVTASNKPRGRGQKMADSPVKAWLKQHASNVEIFQPEKINSGFVLRISNLNPDIGVIASYGKILPKTLLDIFEKRILNIHPSLLPKYRGPSPIQRTILNGDEKTGVTVMLVDEKMDHGPILVQRELGFPIFNVQFSELHDMLAKLSAELLMKILPKWINGEIVPFPQDESKATYTKMLKKEDGLINFSWPREKIDRFVRALNPWPGTYIKTKDGKILKIKKFHPLIVQLEGKKEMTYEEFLRGHKNFSLLGD